MVFRFGVNNWGLLFYLPIHKGFSLVEKLKNGRVSDLRLFVY
ncbi:Uncharacterised protein [Streptococcus pneumoniae]|nr:Uncharacterised protein [Streptococcus pneumoniae]